MEHASALSTIGGGLPAWMSFLPFMQTQASQAAQLRLNVIAEGFEPILLLVPRGNSVRKINRDL